MMNDFAEQLVGERAGYDKEASTFEAAHQRETEEGERAARLLLAQTIKQVLGADVDCQTDKYAILGLKHDTDVALMVGVDREGGPLLLAIYNDDGHQCECVRNWHELMCFIDECEQHTAKYNAQRHIVERHAFVSPRMANHLYTDGRKFKIHGVAVGMDTPTPFAWIEFLDTEE